MNIIKLKKQIEEEMPDQEPYLSKDGTAGMFSAQNDGIKYGKWKLGNKILKLIEKEELKELKEMIKS